MAQENVSNNHSIKNPIKEGWLQKQSRHLGVWRQRWVVLEGFTLHTFKKEKDYTNATETIDLKVFTSVKSSQDRTHKAFSFDVYNSDNSDNSESRFSFVAKSEHDKDDWIRHIGKAIVLTYESVQTYLNEETKTDSSANSSDKIQTSKKADTPTETNISEQQKDSINEEKNQSIEIKQESKTDSDSNLEWDIENFNQQFLFPKENNAEFIENNKVILYGSWWMSKHLLIKNETNQNTFKCKLLKLAKKSDTEMGENDKQKYKLCFGLMHKCSERSHYTLDSFDIVNGQIQDIDHVTYRDKDHKDYNDEKVNQLNGKIICSRTYNSNGKWDKNWFDQKIKAGDTFGLIIKKKEKKLVYFINDEEVASLIVAADYPIDQVSVGFEFHIYRTKEPTIIQLL